MIKNLQKNIPDIHLSASGASVPHLIGIWHTSHSKAPRSEESLVRTLRRQGEWPLNLHHNRQVHSSCVFTSNHNRQVCSSFVYKSVPWVFHIWRFKSVRYMWSIYIIISKSQVCSSIVKVHAFERGINVIDS